MREPPQGVVQGRGIIGHTFSNHLFHVVFSTKERRGWLTPRRRRRLLPYLGGIADKASGRLLRAGGTGTHLHLLMAVEPATAVADLVWTLKANSSRWLKSTYGCPEFAWQAGYASFSVSESNRDAVAEYVGSQEAHHGRYGYEKELSELLRRHGVDFDPRHYLD